MNMKAKLEAEATPEKPIPEQLALASGRPLQEFTHAYTVERMLLLEHYIGNLVNILGQFHPYLQPQFENLAGYYNQTMQELNDRHPIAGLILPPGTTRQ